VGLQTKQNKFTETYTYIYIFQITDLHFGLVDLSEISMTDPVIEFETNWTPSRSPYNFMKFDIALVHVYHPVSPNTAVCQHSSSDFKT
jgi:hypothetical protein